MVQDPFPAVKAKTYDRDHRNRSTRAFAIPLLLPFGRVT
jgi:hypothetical protein